MFDFEGVLLCSRMYCSGFIMVTVGLMSEFKILYQDIGIIFLEQWLQHIGWMGYSKTCHLNSFICHTVWRESGTVKSFA